MKTAQLFWIGVGAIYGIAMRLLFGHAFYLFGANVVSMAFMFGAPFAIGGIVIYGLRHTRPSIGKMIFAPWLAILLALIGSALTLLEGSVCIVLASPLFFGVSSIGGLIMGLVLRWSNKGTTTLRTILLLPVILTMTEPAAPRHPQWLEERVSIEVAASPHRIWGEILNAQDIRGEEMPVNFMHWIGVPRPVEGVNIVTPEGEVRYSKWEHGINFSALVTERILDRKITWRYRFTPDSFPDGSLDEHVKIGGQYFDLYDTTFNLVPASPTLTRLEIVSHYRVTTSLNFYGVPIARLIAHDFMSTILGLYKLRSERGMN